MRILVACEFSGVVRDAFREKGHDAWSCDIEPSEGSPEYHYQGNVFDIIDKDWDMMLAFPPCTHLSGSGARWWYEKREDGSQEQAIEFFLKLAYQPHIPKIALENPVGIMSSVWRKPAQIIQPWQFGHGETKATCLWLKQLPKLTPTKEVDGRWDRIWRIPPGPERAKERSRTYRGIAQAMADQWG